MTSSSYNEMEEPLCKFCGDKILANRNHFHGSVPTIHRYSNCRSSWFAFRKKIEDLRQSGNQNMSRIASRVESAVFEKNEPAKTWLDELNTILAKIKERRRRNEKDIQTISSYKWKMFWKHATNS